MTIFGNDMKMRSTVELQEVTFVANAMIKESHEVVKYQALLDEANTELQARGIS